MLESTRGNSTNIREDGHSEESVEPVLVVPCHLTSVLYRALADAKLVSRRWHAGGRHGSRTHPVTNIDGVAQSAKVTRMGLPVLVSAVPIIESWLQECRNRVDTQEEEEDSSLSLPKWKALLAKEASSVILVRNGPVVMAKNVPLIPKRDNTVHPERAPAARLDTPSTCSRPAICGFKFVELFAGIGGFAMGLEALGGTCVFASEIDEGCRAIYEANVDMSAQKDGVYGDICSVPTDAVPDHDLLVGGFPCQPFSSLGEQRGLADTTARSGNRGMLFAQIVRILKEKRPKAFLLENVPGLVGTDGGRALSTIQTALDQEAGYNVTVEIVSSSCLTAQSRKRLFLVGLRRPIQSSNNTPDEILSPPPAVFEFPYIPDLGMRAVDILERDVEVWGTSNHDDRNVSYQITEEQFEALQTKKKAKWKASKLAWPDQLCDTLDAHYGASIAKGNSQLVPCAAPLVPRKFTPLECKRLMGFSNDFQLFDPTSGNELRSLYRMMGNAVCPPIIAAIAGSILHHILPLHQDPTASSTTTNMIDYGRHVAVQLALDAIRPDRRDIISNKAQALTIK